MGQLPNRLPLTVGYSVKRIIERATAGFFGRVTGVTTVKQQAGTSRATQTGGVYIGITAGKHQQGNLNGGVSSGRITGKHQQG